MSQDYIALEWVKGEIEETLQQAQQALEAYVENPQDSSRLKFCLSYLHQIHGTLQMVEFYGAALLAEEMEAVASAVADGALSNEREGLEILIQAIIQLPHYLEHVKVGRRDLPVVLLPILNELRSARGEAFLSETALFAPKIPHVQPLSAAQLKPFETEDFAHWIRKVRQMLQAATLQLLQNKQPDVAKQYLNKVFARLNKALAKTPQGLVWLPALAFSDWLMKQKSLPNSAKSLLRQLDHQLKVTIENPVQAVNEPPAGELLKNILFYVARTDVKSEAIRDVQERFGLRQALPTEEEIRQEQDALAGPDKDTVGNVLGALTEEIAAVKDRLDLLVRSDEDRASALNELNPSLKQIADTMGMLGLGMPRKVLQEQQGVVAKMLDDGDISDAGLLDIAGALLYVEATISGMQREGDLNARENSGAMTDAQKAVLREARNVLEQVKDAIVEYIAKQWSLPELDDVPRLLHSIEGSLSMIPLPRVAAILSRAASFVQHDLIDQQMKPEWAILDILADVLSGIEYFVERYSENPRSAGEDLLQKAEKSLDQLPASAAAPEQEDFSFDGDEQLPVSEAPASTEFSLADDDSAPSDEEEIIYAAPEKDDTRSESSDDAQYETAQEATSLSEPPAEPEPQAPAAVAPPPAEEDDDDDDLIDDEIIEIFLEEAEEVGETLGEFWPQFKANQDDNEALTTVRRAFHTLKGSGRMVKAEFIGELAWSVENMFNRVLDDTIGITQNLIDLVDYVIDQLPTLIDDFRNRRPSSIDTQPLMDYAFALAAGELVQPFASQSSSSAQPEAEAAEEFDEEDEANALLEVFETEAGTHLVTVDEFVSQSAAEDYLNPLSDHLQRALHTLKGSAHMAGVTAIAEVASPLERLIKELRAYQVANSQEIVALLRDGSALIGHALTDRALLQVPALAGAQEYIARIDELEHRLLQPLQSQEESRPGPNPQAIAQFLAQGMDSLLDADRLLQQWERDNDSSVLTSLGNDLEDVAAGAKEAEIPHIQALAEALNTLYQRVEQQQAAAETELLKTASDAHETILSMMDCLAAGQETQPATELIETIRDWQLGADDNAIADLPDVDEVSMDELSASEPELTPSVSGASYDDEPVSAAENEQPPLPTLEEGDDEILDIFLEEAQEISESVESAIQQWRNDPENLVHVAQLQRELHTLKGGARMAELSAVADLCHELETLYENINDGRLGVQPEVFSLIERAHDQLSEQVDAVRSGLSPAPATATIEALRQYLKGEAFAGVPEYAVDETSQEVGAPVSQAPADSIHSEALDESDREILDIFIEEASELQETLDRTLHDWEQNPDQLAEAEEAQRVLHTLKGGARLAGLTDIGDMAHDFEARILKAQQGQIARDSAFFQDANRRQDELISRVERVANALASDAPVMLGEKSLTLDETDITPPPASPQDDSSADADLPDGDEVVADNVDQPAAETEVQSNVVPLRRDNNGATVQETAPAEQPQPAKPQQNVRKAPQELVKVSADLLDNLVNLAGETSIGRGRLEQQVTDFSYTIDEMDMTLERLRDQLRRLDMETEAQVLFRQERQGPDYEDFDPLEMDRYSTIQQLSRALVESASDLADLKDTLGGKTRDAETLLLQQSRVNTELQEGLMKTRMVPFQRLVPRLRRIVRQISLELGKQVELRVHNADGEMDRTILERMISPLEHMVRNAVDHGIESRDERTGAGKPDVGSIDLDISRDGGDVVLTLTDDGKGVNLPAVRRKAIERGLMTEDARLSDEEIMQFILQAGFSTAESVTQISGRGVGMDVVSSEIKQMGGSVAIQSETGVGTRFVIRLPFTVSVNRALMVRVGEDLYAVPLNNIQGIVRAPVNQLQNLYDKPQTERLYEYAGTDYRVEYLGVMLDTDAQPKLTGQTMPMPLLLIRGATPYALQVDSLLGSREIVVKTLGPQFASVMGVSGGTILGDGNVVIILDLPAMIRTQASLEYQQAKLLDSQEAERRHELENRLPRVLVVDDSVTVRKVTSRLLERNGMEVFTAKDGMDAMETLQDHKPDLMLLDIEMPRMDGFEVASLIRHDERLKDIPIIMITSRTGDKHRERAMSIGVNEYLGKPFQEEKLLDTMNRLLGIDT
ncbi:MAG: hybrid sensor histidine kinase/response regulator [Oceanospirillaceae bacterium]|mgnify:FL=1|nr:hybrid sensor histidine kinase/response regulator [Oceanospirillaceae bacterium]MBT11230.1 hybrid sensor histidine kinase/response regulator [Oceanospirillaceae bacterium]|tara:strand:+ start:74711 stop:81004 length:6294 start_codon:yes stop_codon:yes gene_type:complete